MKNVPELRFAGFDGEWESSRLSDISTINPKSGKLPEIFKYVDLASVTGTNLTNYTILMKEDAPSRAQRLSEKGDIFYQTVRPYQRNNYLFDLDDDDYVFSTGYAQIRTNQKPSFIFAIMQTNKFVDTVMNRTTGTSFPAISTTDLSDIDIKITPNKEEQAKIGELLKKIDTLIEKQEDKVAKMEDFKNSMLQKMFPKKGELVPEFRFKGFDGEWKEVLVSELLDYEQPTKYIVSSEDYIEDGTPVLTANKSFLLGYTDEKNIYNKGEVILIDDFTLDNKYVDFPFMVKSSALKILTEKNSDLFFVYNLLNKIDFINEGHKRHYISIVQNTKVSVPSIEEQQRIGNFFKNLDAQIETEKRLLDSYKMMKKSLLQKMFV